MKFLIVTLLYLEMLTEVLSLKKKNGAEGNMLGQTVLAPDKAQFFFTVVNKLFKISKHYIM